MSSTEEDEEVIEENVITDYIIEFLKKHRDKLVHDYSHAGRICSPNPFIMEGVKENKSQGFLFL